MLSSLVTDSPSFVIPPSQRVAELAVARDSVGFDAFLDGRMRLSAVVRYSEALVLWIRREQPDRDAAVLSKQRRIVKLLVMGASQKQIAFELGVSLSTVSVHIRSVLVKLGLERPEHLILLAHATSGISEADLVAMSHEARQARVQSELGDFALQLPLDPEVLDRLTTAELEVTLLALQGHNNATIARFRCTSPRTVANQVAAVLRKLTACSRLELAGRLLLRGARDRVASVYATQHREAVVSRWSIAESLP
jgi:DNA-binding NarL/FixJ family response regulator